MKEITFPKISVITPSFNQAEYLERTIKSVLDQKYPNLEFIIIDGGSNDGSVEIIKKYSSNLHYWVSEPDHGQAHAINKGLKIATGEWVCWQNSDDIFYPDSFISIAKVIKRIPNLELIIGDINLIEHDGDVIREMRYVKPTYNSLIAEGMVLTNQAAFWRKSLHESIGYLDEELHYGFDYEWFLRMLKHFHNTYHINQIIGALRYHPDTKTSNYQTKFDAEYGLILKDIERSKWKKLYYLLRRFFLTLANGHASYLLRGIKSRVYKSMMPDK